MQFADYLRKCRLALELTQEQLVEALYLYDAERFRGVSPATLSRWEHGVVAPHMHRKRALIGFFQEKRGEALPCWKERSMEETEEEICRLGIGHLLGGTRRLVLDFPSEVIRFDELEVVTLREGEDLRRLVAFNMDVHLATHPDPIRLSEEQFLSWSRHPGSRYFACRYRGSYVGLLFLLKLRSEPFEKILRYEMRKSELTEEDFALPEERGFIMPLAFFALHEKAAIMLIVRFYSYLIANQDAIDGVGLVTSYRESRRLVEGINLQATGEPRKTEGSEIQAYRQSLDGVIASEMMVKILFEKERCPEEPPPPAP
ncbi:helix-turn-helix domain-containing protein [Nitratifractor sp.]